MEFLTQLWLPIVVAAVFVFIVSSVLHMVLPFHRSDYGKLKGEDAVLEAMRASGVEPGAYMFPSCESMKEWNSPEMVEKRKQGPIGLLTVVPAGGFNMGRSLLLWFLYCLVVSLFVAYASWHGLGADAHYLTVFRVAGAAAVLGYALGVVNETIWKGQRWGTTVKFIVDGVIYALVTAGTFGWLWPGA